MPPNAYWVTQMEIVRYSGHPTTVSLFFNVIFILLVLLPLNELVKRIKSAWALTRQELLVVYVMLTVASTLTGHDLIQVLTPQMSHPHRFATTSNQWRDIFFPYLPDWLMVKDPVALKGAYEGTGSFWGLYRPEYYRPWLGPVLWWTLFISGMVLSLLCLNTILRKRWTENEKLSYPLTQIPLELTDVSKKWWLNSWFLIGFGIAAFIDVMNGFNTLYPNVPLFKTRVVHFDEFMNSLWTQRPWTALRGTRLSFYPFGVGLGLLLPVDLLFSCWFFFLFSRLELVLTAQFGWDQIPQFPYIRQQAHGAYVAIAVAALWMARGYLKEVFKKVIGLRSTADDADEPVGYRVAFIGFALGAGMMIWFGCRLGLSLWIAVIFFLIYFVMSISVTRIRAELGPPAHDLHHAGPDQALSWAFGTGKTAVWDEQNQIAAKLLFWFNRAYRGHPQPFQLEGMRIAQIMRTSQRRFWFALLLAGVFGTLSGFWAQLHCYYQYGMSSKIVGPAQWAFGVEPYNEMKTWLLAPLTTNVNALVAGVVGFVFTLLLNLLRLRLNYFPLHPVGFATSTSWSMNALWMPLLIAWMTKVALMRYGGSKSYRTFAVPFALGLVLGEFIPGSLWTIYGIITGKQTYGFWV
jgi:hypothetical protein